MMFPGLAAKVGEGEVFVVESASRPGRVYLVAKLAAGEMAAGQFVCCCQAGQYGGLCRHISIVKNQLQEKVS